MAEHVSNLFVIFVKLQRYEACVFLGIFHTDFGSNSDAQSAIQKNLTSRNYPFTQISDL